ncbi:hypothetical protein BP6252_07815 [Coleophoma cylindrospora]|uniref:DUF3074 domain-containing protein n=1 Tax=Coleophoma cylindrospora TaxID=1849047 RepID=A0A3D8RB36_9HELO|nr:hypothetical protein BP6252_07815 [Coleophoma cylindrospora]
MAALHNALKSLGPTEYSDVPISSPEALTPYLSDAFSAAQLIVDSVPNAAPSGNSVTSEQRERASSTASNASEMEISDARSSPPPADVEALQKEWKPVKLNPRDNPLGISVYKLGGKDGKGAWFARKSVHEGLGFTKWKKSLEREFPETLKVQGAPGEGNIRGIGGERRVEYKSIEGVGNVEVYHLSAQFPGPTAPRDFVTLLITSDQALKPHSESEEGIPRHYMVISKPCIHPDAQPRDGFIRGQYESVEFIREIPRSPPRKSMSASNLLHKHEDLGKEAILRNASKQHPEFSQDDSGLSRSDSGRARGKTISFAESRGADAKGEDMDKRREVDDENELNPVEWIMITRSDPGGSVPRFLIERGTPGGIVADASKFLNWACAIDLKDLESGGDTENALDKEPSILTKEEPQDFNVNGHLAGLERGDERPSEPPPVTNEAEPAMTNDGGIYGMVAGAAGMAGDFIAANVTAKYLPGQFPDSSTTLNDGSASPMRRDSISTVASTSSIGSFTSALSHGPISRNGIIDDTTSDKTATSDKTETDSMTRSRASSQQDKELQKLEDRKRKLDEKLSKARENEQKKKSEDTQKEADAIKKAEERHERELAKLESKKEKEIAKLEAKRRKDEQKAEEKKRKATEKDEKTRLARELEEIRAEVLVLRKEKDLMRDQIGDLQAENTVLAAKLGRLGPQGEEVLKEARQDVGKGGRKRGASLRGLKRNGSTMSVSLGSLSSGEKEKQEAV